MTDSVQQISLFAAFTAGLLSFVSPCVLPLVPSYISYITGLSVEQLADAFALLRRDPMVHRIVPALLGGRLVGAARHIESKANLARQTDAVFVRHSVCIVPRRSPAGR